MRTNNKVGWYSFIFEDHLMPFGEMVKQTGQTIHEGLLGVGQLLGAMIVIVIMLTIPLWVPLYVAYALIKDYRSLSRFHNKVVNNQISDSHAHTVFGLLIKRYNQTGLEMYRQGQLDCMLALSDNNQISLTEAKRRLNGEQSDDCEDGEDIDQTERMQMRVDKDLRL